MQVGSIAGEITMVPRHLRSNHLTWVNPERGAKRLSPNVVSGDLAPRLVADGRVEIASYVTHELSGLAEFERAVDVTLRKDRHGAFGPAQLVLAE